MNEREEMIREFQCSGCANGPDGDGLDTCSGFEIEEQGTSDGYFNCKGHVPGTMKFPTGMFLLGMPKGFCKLGVFKGRGRHGEPEHGNLQVRLYLEAPLKLWDKFNVPVWAMEKDGFLFVRTFSPRINRSSVDVVKGGSLALVPKAIDVGEFYDEID